MNFLLTFLIFYGVSLVNGRQYYATTTIGYVEQNSAASNLGFVAGDKLLSIDGKALKNWEDIQADFYLNDIARPLAVTLDRGGQIINVTVPKGILKSDEQIGFYPEKMHAVIETVFAGKPASKAGLLPGDEVLSVNGNEIVSNAQVVAVVQQNKGKQIRLGIKRGNQDRLIEVTPNSDGKIGIEIGTEYTGPVENFRYNVLTAIPVGFDQTISATALLIQSLARIVTGQASFTKSIGGPIKIAQLATQSAEMGLMSFLSFMALLSISLAVLNVLPFPALDGGHLAFLVYESVFRREVPTKIKLFAQQVGFALLLLFMAFVIYNDIVHF